MMNDHAGPSHDHAPHGAHHPGERVSSRPLIIALAITSAFLVAEVIGGIVTGSLALLADAAHMGTDVAALSLSLFAIWLAGRPATPERSFGYLRAEVLAALINAAALVAISFSIVWEAYDRLDNPPRIESGVMLAVAVAGLAANAASAWVLMRGGAHTHNLNIRGALLHVLGDLLGSVAAITAALLMLLWGWYLADPVLSVAIGVLILWSSFRLLRESVDILLEATPKTIDANAVRAAMVAVPGVRGIHDLHIWTVASGLIAMSAHVEVTGERDWHETLFDLTTLLRERFGIAHVTLQPEEPGQALDPFPGCSLDSPEGQQACLAALPVAARPSSPERSGHRERETNTA